MISSFRFLSLRWWFLNICQLLIYLKMLTYYWDIQIIEGEFINLILQHSIKLWYWQDTSGFEKHDFCRVLSICLKFWLGKISSDFSPIYKIPKFHIASAHPTNFWSLQIVSLGTKPKIWGGVKYWRFAYAFFNWWKKCRNIKLNWSIIRKFYEKIDKVTT